MSLPGVRAQILPSRLRVAAWSAAAFPVAVLSHEFAHFAFYKVFSFPDVKLHFGSASYAGADRFWQLMDSGEISAASKLFPAHRVGAAALAGILATFVVIALCLFIESRRAHPFWTSLALIAPLRFLGSLFVIIALLLGRTRSNGSDEGHVAMTLHVPEIALHLVGIAALVATWLVVLRMPQNRTKFRRSATVAGIVAGAVLYIGVLGPVLLP